MPLFSWHTAILPLEPLMYEGYQLYAIFSIAHMENIVHIQPWRSMGDREVKLMNERNFLKRLRILSPSPFSLCLFIQVKMKHSALSAHRCWRWVCPPFVIAYGIRRIHSHWQNHSWTLCLSVQRVCVNSHIFLRNCAVKKQICVWSATQH